MSYGRVLQLKETAVVNAQGDIGFVVVVGLRVGVLVQDAVAELAFDDNLRNGEIVKAAGYLLPPCPIVATGVDFRLRVVDVVARK